MRMHRASKLNRRIAAIGFTATWLLASCDGSIQVGGIQGSGAPAPATAVGPITAFGSVFVNGIEYATSGAQIRIDDQSGAESQLNVGHIVTVKGSVNADGTTGTAREISFNGDVQGPVTEFDVTDSTFIVLGQTVRVTDSTLFDESIQPAGVTGLEGGILVEVSGFPNAAGEIVASRIDLKPAGDSLQVRGVVQALDTIGHTFRINALTVDYSGSVLTGSLAEGNVVVVHGTAFTATGALLATRVAVSAGFDAAANDRADIEGIITSFTSNADFRLQGQRVTTDANTRLVLHGVTLGVNVKIDVEGSFDASGVLRARMVEVKPESSSRLGGLVDVVTAESNTLSVLGVNVTTNAATQFQDKSSQHLRLFRLSDLRAGDYIEVRGTPSETGEGFSAAILERDRPESHSHLQGSVLNVADPTLTVLGISVTTNAQTRFSGPGGAATGAAAFFSHAPNHVVRVRGTVSGGFFAADQAQIVR
jgi:hypothetical protein